MSGTLDELLNVLKKYRLEDVKKAVALLEDTRSNKQSSAQPLAAISSSTKEVNEANISDEMKAKALKVFNAADKDKSGTIDETELHALLTELLGPISLPESNLIYKEMDTNHSGTITFDEFLVGLVKYSWDFSKIANREVLSYEWEVPFKELTLEKKLGEGIFGIVYKAKWRGATVACKKLKNPDMVEEINDFKREIAILAKLRHPNVVLFMGACTSDGSNMAIITEFLEGGNLHEIVHEKRVRFDFKTNLSLIRQTAFGLNYLHLSNIVHRDLKLANILVDKYYNCKLCDFGLSCVKPAQSDITDAVGSPLWRAPELLLKKPYNQSADVYSFALCSWELLSLEQPYLDIDDWDQLVTEVAIQGKRPAIPSFISSELGYLLKQSWDQDPKKRPNMAQIIAQLERVSNTSQ